MSLIPGVGRILRPGARIWDLRHLPQYGYARGILPS
jgi:hypothetical protein